MANSHIIIVDGGTVLLTGITWYALPRFVNRPLFSTAMASASLWFTVIGVFGFYLSWLVLGLVEGAMVRKGWDYQLAKEAVGSWHSIPTRITSTIMRVGYWTYVLNVLLSAWVDRHVKEKPFGYLTKFAVVSALALVVGTLQGLLQVFPATAYYLTVAEEVPNIHAQLNMIGGVLPALIGLVYWLLPQLVGERPSPTLVKRSLFGITGGIGANYLATLSLGLVRAGFMRQGMSGVQAAEQLGGIAPWILLITAVTLLIGFAAFGTAVYRVTPTYRANAAAEMRQSPARFAGPMPERLRRIPLIYVIGMELLGGLFGWPGLGWLYSGQAMIAVAMMLIGPAIAWALLPMLFSPFTDTVFSQWGWHTLLVWLPASALLSSGLLALFLHRSRAQVRLKSGKTAVAASKAASSSSKPRVRIPRGLMIGAGLVLLTLFSVPIIPLLVGLPGETGTNVQPVVETLSDRANGAYLNVADEAESGLIKLFAWSFPVDDFPLESPGLNPSQMQGFTIRQKGLDSPESYRLFHLEGDSGHEVLLRATEISFQTELLLQPVEPLDAGNYMLDIPTGGMFAGRDYYYFRIDPAITALPPIVRTELVEQPEAVVNTVTPGGRTAVSWLEIFPLSSAVLSGAMALIMANRLRRKVRPHEAAWTVAFAMFAIAAGSQLVGDVWGWSTALARLYYVFGATLVVGWLGLGTWLVIVHKPQWRNAGIWLVLFFSGYALGLVTLTTVNPALLATEGWGALEKPLILTILTISVNSLGTVVLVGGALWSAWVFWRKGIMRTRMVGLLLLAGGALVVAAGGSLTRFGHEQYLYIAMSLGILLMFVGYLKTIQPLVGTAVPAEPRLATAPMQP